MLQLKQFINQSQLSVMNENPNSETFKEIKERIKTTIETMPKTYETDGQGDDAIVYLHYFNSSFDWYITERDMEDEQIQAFGLAKMAFTEFGYISINELLENNVELDFYWTPKRVGDFK